MKINSNTVSLNRKDAQFKELENIITKIASDNSIDNVEFINIKLSPEAGYIGFKTAEDLAPDPNKSQEVANPQGSNLGTSSLPVPTQPPAQAPIEEPVTPEPTKEEIAEAAEMNDLLKRLNPEDVPEAPAGLGKAPITQPGETPAEASLPPDLMQQAFPEKSEVSSAAQPSEKPQV